MKLLTAVASTGSPCLSVRIFWARWGRADFLDCQGKASGLLHVSSKSSGSQSLGRGGRGVTSLPVSLSARRGHPLSLKSFVFQIWGSFSGLVSRLHRASPRGHPCPFRYSPFHITKHHSYWECVASS